MGTDPRVSFANKLIELGIVGKSQNKVFIQVAKFYMGEFSDFGDE